MIGFINDHRAEYGVEPICRVLPIAPSTFYENLAVARDPARASDRGKAQKTTRPDKALPCPRDKVNRQFPAPAPNMLWVSDFTFVSTWQGFVYVAFVIDTSIIDTSIIGLFKAEVVHRMGPWKTADAVEWETLKWVDWFNKRRLLQPIGKIPPAEAEEKFYEQRNELDKVA